MIASSALLLGATSIVGYQLARSFSPSVLPFVTPHHPNSTGWPILNLQDRAWIEAQMKAYEPAAILYCHAVCDVPKCEAAPEWAWEMNVNQLKNVLAASEPGIRFVYISSDHVFGGDGSYHEQSTPCPISAYGRTRVAAETLVLEHANSMVVRAGLAIGPSLTGRSGHLDWLRYRMRRNLPVTIVEDEYRSAVWATDLAERIMALARSRATGLCHVTATRPVSRVQLADHLLSSMSLRAEYRRESRHERHSPHLGRVELATMRSGALYEPLPSVLDSSRSTEALRVI